MNDHRWTWLLVVALLLGASGLAADQTSVDPAASLADPSAQAQSTGADSAEPGSAQEKPQESTTEPGPLAQAPAQAPPQDPPPAGTVDTSVDPDRPPDGELVATPAVKPDGFARMVALLSTLLALAGLVIGLWLRQGMARLQTQLTESEARQQELLAARSEPATKQELQALRGELQTLRAQVQAALRTTPTVVAAASPRSAPEPASPPPPAVAPLDAVVRDLQQLPAGEVGVLLVRLHQDVSWMAAGFDDRELRRELEQLGQRLPDRLRRFTEAAEGKQLETGWVENDLVPLLDQLARLQSAAVEEARGGNSRAAELGRRLYEWLYRQLGDACRDRGWFALEPVLPYETRFDPGIHHALAGKDVPGLSRVVVAVKAVGRRHPESGAVQHKAQVIVAR